MLRRSGVGAPEVRARRAEAGRGGGYEGYRSFRPGKSLELENRRCELETGEGDKPPRHLMVLKLASLALRTLRVLELRFYEPSHSPSAPPPHGDKRLAEGQELEHRRCAVPTVHCTGLCPIFTGSSF